VMNRDNVDLRKFLRVSKVDTHIAFLSIFSSTINFLKE
jgi:hypothetical protein